MASKGKVKLVEKQSKSPPAIQVATSVDTKDIVPGNLSDKEWNELIEMDESVETVCEIVEEIVKKALDIMYENYLEREVFSYAVQRAKETFLNIIGLQFIARDEGETNTATDPSWLPSEKPVPAPIHPRALGMIPLATRESLTSLADALEPMKVHRPVEDGDVTSSSRRFTDATITSLQTSSNTSPIFGKSKKKVKRRAVAKRTEARLVTLQEKPSILGEEQPGNDQEEPPSLHADSSHPPANEPTVTPFGLKPVQLSRMKEVKYDKKGNIINMIQLDPTKFPSHCIKPLVTVIHPPKSPHMHGLTKRPVRLKPMESYPHPPSRGRPQRSNATKKSPFKSMRTVHHQDSATVEGSSSSDSNKICDVISTLVMPSSSGLSTKTSNWIFPEMPTMSSLDDTLPGVTVREGGRSVHGPTPHYPTSHLRPVQSLREGEMGVVIGREEGKGVETEITQKHNTHQLTA